MQPIKIALGDLRHGTLGRHSVFMPVGIGYIASYTLAKIDSEAVEVRLYDDPNIILKDIDNWKPEIVGLSNYSWNSDLSRLVFKHAKKTIPGIACIAGGPEFPIDTAECKEYLSKRPEIDFYVYFEGEPPFAELINKICKGSKIEHLKSKPQKGVMSINPKTKELIFGESFPRLINMDEIPSPYLSGLMDQYFNGYYVPSIETARGCPFSCGFCFGGQPWFSSVATFGIERIKNELTYIAQKMRQYPDIMLSICDSNFGMYKRDEEIANHIRGLQDKFGWPRAFNTTTGKANYDRILKIAGILKNRMNISCSVQSLNPKTLEVIKRRNPAMDELRRISAEIKKRGMRVATEVIAPMPEETKTSFFNGLKSIINTIGTNRVVPYTTMLLKGTYLASKECREKYKMQTKFRIIPRQIGEYIGKKCFEIEEVCVATNTMSFDDYLETRGFALISSFFCSEQFDFIHRHLIELNINAYDYLYHLWELVKLGKTELSDTYNEYIEKTKEELWDSKEAICKHFTKQENYDKLLSEKLGDNLIRKYKTVLLLEKCIPSIELAYSSIMDIAPDIINERIHESLNAAKRWMIALRNVSAVFKKEPYLDIEEILRLPYDVHTWYINSSHTDPLIMYNRPVNYKVFCDTNNLRTIFDDMEKLYTEDLSFQVGKLLVNCSIKNFWRQCELVKE